MALEKVTAVEAGHDGRVYRQAGETFMLDTADERYKGATWFQKGEDGARAVVKPSSSVPPGAGPKAGSGQRDPGPHAAFLERNVPEIVTDLPAASTDDLRAILEAERADKDRKGVTEAIAKELEARG